MDPHRQPPSTDVVGIPAGLPRIRTKVVPRLVVYLNAHVECDDCPSTATLAVPVPVAPVPMPGPVPEAQTIACVAGSKLREASQALDLLRSVGSTWLDVTITADDAIDPDCVRRVAGVLAELRRTAPATKLQVSLPAMASGLSGSCLNAVHMVAHVDVVNGLVSEFGCADRGLEALASVRRQLQKLANYARDAHVPMAAVTLDDSFAPADAVRVARYAARHADWAAFVGCTTPDLAFALAGVL